MLQVLDISGHPLQNEEQIAVQFKKENICRASLWFLRTKTTFAYSTTPIHRYP